MDLMADITSTLRTHQVTFMVIIIRICATGERTRKRITELTSYSVCTDYVAPYSIYNFLCLKLEQCVSVR